MSLIISRWSARYYQMKISVTIQNPQEVKWLTVTFESILVGKFNLISLGLIRLG